LDGRIWACVFGYVAIGTSWAFFQWSRFVKGELAHYESEKLRFLQFHRIKNGNGIPDFLRYEWRAMVALDARLQQVPPVLHDYRAGLILNVLLWPVSMLVMAAQKGYQIAIAQYTKTTKQQLERIRKDLE